MAERDGNGVGLVTPPDIAPVAADVTADPNLTAEMPIVRPMPSAAPAATAEDRTDPEPAPADSPDTPALSIVIACLNAEATLGVQLEALTRQNCPVPWEVLVSDNGSTDGSRELAASYADRLPGLRVIDASAQRGAGPARNLGVREARGRWVAFCDADDEVADDWVASMAGALAENRFVAGTFESYKLNAKRVLRSRPMEQQDELQSTGGGPDAHAGAGNMGIHRADFLRVGGFDPAIPWLEDTDFCWRVQKAGIPLVYRREIVVHVRLRHTYRAMFVQGWQYGLAQALLERRYTLDTPVDEKGTEQPWLWASASERARRVTTRAFRTVRNLSSWVMEYLVAGRLVWRLGWAVGHRSPESPAAQVVSRALRLRR